ncbi:hypothetical protein H2200_009123 [Cladophialophora chaetospira]|uniref:C3H1-type domain-containing protein n=1 Tax=Cladophialophora chaetospira TaxID=386627 RepID=A0AA38X3K3_9EURO|nr:hypothetical protein H2200_009123 [Cladophialophora chaetospira]
MAGTFEMDALYKRLTEVRAADHKRDALLDDLFRKMDDMQKTMDRNAFTLVLIDGDCTLFLNDLVKKGIHGGDAAAKLLRKAVFEYLRNDPHFKHDHKIIIRIYANLRGLTRTYIEKGILPNTTLFTEFVLGFNKAHPLCDFIDAGNHKEAADQKLKENLNLYVYNVHCKQIIFGGSADNGYASFLGSIYDTDISSRIKLLKGLPFAPEFTNILPKLQWTEFTDIFRSESLVDETQPKYYARQSMDPIKDQNKTTETTAPDSPPSINGHEGGTRLGRYQKDSDTDSDDVAIAPLGPVLTDLTNEAPPPAKEVEAALIASTNARLALKPEAIDFGSVKHDVELKLGLTSDYWGKNEQTEWFVKSKNIIKKAVEDWMDRTGNPPPKNATWLRQYFAPPPRQELPPPASHNSSSPERSVDPDKLINDIRAHRILVEDGIGHIARNNAYQRIDLPDTSAVPPYIVNGIRNREPRLCNSHYLLNCCNKDPCPYDHESQLSDEEFAALLNVSRGQVCLQGGACKNMYCIKGHMCPNGKNCKYGEKCRFARVHGMDTTVADQNWTR